MISRHTILYAEDDPDDVQFVTKAFEAHDHIKVLHSPNGKEALQKLGNLNQEGIKPCLIVLDINMPIMNGKDALVKIRENREYDEVPIVLFTTSSSDLDKRFAQKWEVELITKPLHFGDIEKIATKFVEKCNFEINKQKY